jgi:hypothetical protein
MYGLGPCPIRQPRSPVLPARRIGYPPPGSHPFLRLRPPDSDIQTVSTNHESSQTGRLPSAVRLRRALVLSAFATVPLVFLSSCSARGDSSLTDRQATFASTGNTSCLRDYRNWIPKIRASSGQPDALISVAASLRSQLALDISALPHQNSDDVQLKTIQADTRAMNDFMMTNGGSLAKGVVPGAGDAVQAVIGLEQAYLQLGLDRCVRPDLAGVPPGMAP